MMRSFCWLAPLACVALISAAHAQNVRIAVVTPLTGVLATVNEPGQNAVRMLVEALNAGTVPAPYNSANGIAGRKVELIFLDESGGNAKQVAEFRTFADRRSVDAVIGFGSSATCLAIAPVAEELKLLTVMSTCATTRVFEDAKYKFVFRTTATATIDGVALARYVLTRTQGIKTYGHINPNFALGRDSWNDFMLAFHSLSPDSKVAVELWPTLGAGNYSAEITALGARRPQVTHTALAGTDLEAFITQMSARGLNKKTQVVASTLELSIYRMAAQIPDGIIFTARGPYGLFAPEAPLNTWFRDSYLRQYKSKPAYTAYQYVISLLAIKAAYEKAAATAPRAIPAPATVAAALTGLSFDAPGGVVRMALSDGHQAVNDTAVGEYVYDKANKQPSVRNVIRFPASCVNPPSGMKSEAWLRAGMPGAKC